MYVEIINQEQIESGLKEALLKAQIIHDKARMLSTLESSDNPTFTHH